MPEALDYQAEKATAQNSQAEDTTTQNNQAAETTAKSNQAEEMIARESQQVLSESSEKRDSRPPSHPNLPIVSRPNTKSKFQENKARN